MAKANPDAANCWSSLFADGSYGTDPWVLDQMQRKLTLQRLQTEVQYAYCNSNNFKECFEVFLFLLQNPGFDFSSAEISGNYQTGGPRLPV